MLRRGPTGSGLSFSSWAQSRVSSAARSLARRRVVRPWGAVSDTSVFEAGSVSKTVTGLLFALAIQAAELSADDRLERYLPDTRRAGQATLVELATHTSGLPRLPAPVLVRALLRATGASWAFIGASGSCAIAAAVPARHQRVWDTVAMQVLSGHGNLACRPGRQAPS